MSDAIWWTGVLAWVLIAALLLWVLWLVVRDAFIAGWHVLRYYSFGSPPVKHPLRFPFQLFWYFWWHCPRFVDRKDNGGRVYRPFSTPRPEDEYV